MARGIAAPMVRGPTGYRLISGGLGPRLDLFAGGTFTRSTEGFTLIGAPTDGSTAFARWDGVNVRRIEYDPNLPGGYGLLMEGARTNVLFDSRDTSGWTAGTATRTTGHNSPDGTASATRFQAASTAYSHYRSGMAPGSPSVFTAWQRQGGIDGSWQINDGMASGDSARGGASGLTTAYTRMEHARAASMISILVVDGRNLTANGGIAADAHDVVTDLHQMEAGYWPSSAIRTTTGAVTRAADVLSYAVGEYPASFLTRGFRYTFVPGFSSAEFSAAVGAGGGMLPATIVSGVNNSILLFNAVGNFPQLRISYENVARSITDTLAWARGSVLTIEVNHITGVITRSGFTSGNGVSMIAAAGGYTWPSGALRWGNNNGASSIFGRFGQYVEAL